MPVLRALGVPLLAHAELELPLSEAAAARVEDGDARDYATYLHSRPPEWEDAAGAEGAGARGAGSQWVLR